MTTPIMRWFDTAHVSPKHGPRYEIARRFQDIAESVDIHLENGPEKSTALRKLLESKDAAVRQVILDEEVREEAAKFEAFP